MRDQASVLAQLSPERRELLLRKLATTTAPSVPPPIRPRARAESKAPPLSFSQQRVWFLDQLAPGQEFYNLPSATRLSYPVDAGVLERSLNEIVRRHENLRTTFQLLESEPVQVIAPELTVSLQRHDLRPLAAVEREREAQRLANEEAQKPFDLGTGPLIRARLLHLNENESLFLLTLHHIVADGWSLGVFWRELSALYTAYSQGQASPLKELPVQYADYAVWQREWLQGAILESQLGYWKKELSGLPPLELPYDRRRPAVQSFRGAYHPIEIPAEVVTGLKRVSQSEGATLFMTLMAAFQLLLGRYSGQNDVAVGTYVAGRSRAELEGLTGFFVNTLVVRTRMEGHPGFRSLLRHVRETCLGAFAHADVPFEMLVETLHPERDLSRNPLVQVTFQLLNTPGLTGGGSGSMSLERNVSVLDMSCFLYEDGARLRGGIEYSTELFDESTIERLARRFVALLRSAAQAGDHGGDLVSFTTPEDGVLAARVNATARPYPPSTVSDLFARASERFGDRTAIFCGTETTSYRELEAQARGLVVELSRAGVAPGVPVGVLQDRSLSNFASLLAIWHLGGVYAPLDPSHPQPRIEWMLSDANVRTLITTRAAAEKVKLPAFAGTTVFADEAADSLAAAPAHRAEPHEPACILYTSGSTGRPKGVVLPHRSILNRLHWMWEEYAFAPDEVACQRTSLTFVDSLWELLGGLLAGVPTVVIPGDDARDPGALIPILHGARVTRIWLTPSLLSAILTTNPHLASALPLLRFWISTGEPLSAELYEQFEASAPHATLFNLYGTSEIWDATIFDPRRDGRPGTRVPIGRSIANVRAYVMDGQGQPQTPGLAGELYVAGDGLALGYISSPEANCRGFVTLSVDGRTERAYRTGDLARLREDGLVECLGRVDRQLKIRGHRVEPGEVEAVLSAADGIGRAVVVERGGELVAYIQPRPGAEPDLDRLSDIARSSLPDYMVPRAIVSMAAIPNTASGKVDYQALPAPDLASFPGRRTGRRASTATEQRLVTIWENILGMHDIGLDEDFFRDLGGHSLLAVRILARVEALLGRRVPLRGFFEHPTIAAVAEAVEKRAVNDSGPIPRQARVLRKLPGTGEARA